MAVAGARELRDGEVVVVGLGLPQVACVLRNLEMELPPGLGCGHSLMCIVEVQE